MCPDTKHDREKTLRSCFDDLLRLTASIPQVRRSWMITVFLKFKTAGYASHENKSPGFYVSRRRIQLPPALCQEQKGPARSGLPYFHVLHSGRCSPGWYLCKSRRWYLPLHAGGIYFPLNIHHVIDNGRRNILQRSLRFLPLLW